MKSYIFSLEAVTGMLVECYRAENNLETGGILIGPKDQESIIIDSISSSIYAERQSYTYYQSEQDVEMMNEVLRKYQKQGYEFKGYYHRHPGGMYDLSPGDLSTCAGILNDESYCINNTLLMCIITETQNNKLPIFLYIASLGDDGNVIIKNISFKIFPKECIEKCIKAKGGGHDEDNVSGQNNEEVEEHGKNRTLWAPKRENNNNQLPTGEQRTQ